MKKILCYLLLLLIYACHPVQNSENETKEDSLATTDENTKKEFPYVKGEIERLDPALDKIIPVDAKMEVIAEGYNWSEGPLWLKDQQMLIYSDVPENKIFSWTEKDGAKLYLEPSGFTTAPTREGELGSNGLFLSPEGKLMLCQHGDRRVARMDAPLDKPKAEYTTVVDKYDGKKFSSPNDGIYDSKGNLYFTDPPYGLVKQAEDPAREMDYCGVFLHTKDGKTILLAKENSRPNGIALSLDEKTLYVANSDPKAAYWKAYPVKADGTVGEGKTFLDVTDKTKTEKGLPDGLKIDNQGNLFATGPGGVLIISPDGKHLGTLKTGEATANCGFNEDKSVLYITADAYIMRIKLR